MELKVCSIIIARCSSQGQHPFLVCKYCGKVFRKAGYNYQTHLNRHLGVKPFKCSRCEKNFVTKAGLQTHHSRCWFPRPSLCRPAVIDAFTCQHCGKVFPSYRRSVYTEHVNRHEGVKPFTCSLCEMAFVSEIELRRHTLHHTGEGPLSAKNAASHIKLQEV